MPRERGVPPLWIALGHSRRDAAPAKGSFAGEALRAPVGVVVKAAMVPGLWLLSLTVVCASVEIRERVGTARDADTGEVLYRELHRERWFDGRILGAEVRYVDAEGDAIGSKRIEFGTDPVLPSFETRDQRSGHLEAGELTEQGYRVRFRPEAGADISSGTLERAARMVADAGIDRMVERAWDTLVQGDEAVFGLVIPSRRDVFDFRVSSSDTGELPGGGVRPDWLVLKVVPESFLLRWVAPEVHLAYDSETRRLRRYAGPSNLRGDDGEPFDVVIDFP